MKLRTEREKYLYKRKRYKILIIVTQILLLVAFLGLWEGAARIGAIDSFITSSPSRIGAMLLSLREQGLWKHIFTTLSECVFSINLHVKAYTESRQKNVPYMRLCSQCVVHFF